MAQSEDATDTSLRPARHQVKDKRLVGWIKGWVGGCMHEKPDEWEDDWMRGGLNGGEIAEPSSKCVFFNCFKLP